MSKIVECVPNVSEGRDDAKIEQMVEVIRNAKCCTLLNYSSDANHNRTVITFIGSPEGVVDAAVELAKKAAELIDLRVQTGEHPRMGAIDVVPFIPIKEVTLEECVEISVKVGERISQEANIPVFLYEKSARRAERENLATVRKGQFEGMAKKVMEEIWEPDFGGRRIHESAGVVAVGARMPLVAFNINLSTSSIDVANNISKVIRRSSGGFDCVKAIGVMLTSRNIAQVSINMTDYTKTPLYRVLEVVRFEAARYGVSVVGTEIIGLTPMRALVDSAEYYMGIEDFSAENQILENYLA